jgi:hypothetical protein
MIRLFAFSPTARDPTPETTQLTPFSISQQTTLHRLASLQAIIFPVLITFFKSHRTCIRGSNEPIKTLIPMVRQTNTVNCLNKNTDINKSLYRTLN